jgi:hypothetical protein
LVVLQDGETLSLNSKTVSFDDFIGQQNFVKNAVNPISKKFWLNKELTLGKSNIKIAIWAVIALGIVIIISAIATYIICVQWKRTKQEKALH